MPRRSETSLVLSAVLGRRYVGRGRGNLRDRVGQDLAGTFSFFDRVWQFARPAARPRRFRSAWAGNRSYASFFTTLPSITLQFYNWAACFGVLLHQLR